MSIKDLRKGGMSLFPKEVMMGWGWAKRRYGPERRELGKRGRADIWEHRYLVIQSLGALLCGLGPLFNLSVLHLREIKKLEPLIVGDDVLGIKYCWKVMQNLVA